MLLNWIFLLFFVRVLTPGKAQPTNCGFDTNELHGVIEGPVPSGSWSRTSYLCVWNIAAPADYNIHLKITSFYLEGQSGSCSNTWLTISDGVANDGRDMHYKMCGSSASPSNITLRNRVKMEYHYSRNRVQSYFTVQYNATRVNITERTERWISEHNETLVDHKESLPRALPALRLFDESYFNKGNIAGYVFKTQYLLKLSADLVRNSTQALSVADLSHHVFALLSICSNPRSFHGIDLMQTLRNALDVHPDVSKPFDLLTVCSAGQNLTSEDVKNLNTVLSTKKPNMYLLDFQAIAVMALICAKQRNAELNVDENLQKTVEALSSYQRNDGSFGSVRSTVLISQALSAAGAPESRWNKKAAIRFVESMNHSDGSFGNIYDMYTVLPILSGKSLLDIKAEKCDFSPEGVSPLQEVKDKMNELISLTYQLRIGDEAEVTHTISLKFSNGTTFFDAMRLAAENDEKFRLKWTFLKNDLYVYQIGKYINDPTGGKYWILYTFNDDGELVPFEKRLEDYIPYDDDTAVMWYKTVHIPH